MLRKILGWIIFVLIFIFIGFVVWLFFFKEDPATNTYEGFSRSEDFFPVNTENGIGEQGQLDENGNPTELVNRNLIPRLRQLSQVPTAGSIAFERKGNLSRQTIGQDGSEQTTTENTVIFRYIERATGHLYEAREDSLTQIRLSNTTIPKVFDASFSNDGERALLKILKEDQETIDTLSASVVSKSTTSVETYRVEPDGFSLEGTFLSQNIISSDISKDGLAYLLSNNSGGSSLITSTFTDLSKKIIFESPLKNWMIDRVNSNNILITNKADSRVSGFSYLVNSQNGSFNKIVGDLTGLTTLMSPNAKWLLYSVSRNNELDLYALNTEDDKVINLGINTLPEKCVFSIKSEDVLFCGAPNQAPRVALPETWYQGRVNFDDNIWKINLSLETYDQILGDKEEVDDSFDVIKPTLSPNDDFVLFINKRDLTLWSLEI